jgi:hypothetical protein
MESLGAILAAAAVVALWLVTILAGRDSRDGRDWRAYPDVREPSPRIGD